MKKQLLLLSLFCLLFQGVYSQKRKFHPADSYSDLSFTTGIYAITGSGDYLGEGTVLSLDYAQFSYNGMGARGGVSYIYELDQDISVLQLPLSFAWRTSLPQKRTPQKKAVDALYGLATPFTPNYQNAVVSLFSFRAEFNGGITPSYVLGDGYYTECWNSYEGTYHEGIHVKNRFGLTADLGVRLSLRVWRFNLLLNPSYHYWLTNNFEAQSTRPISQPSRSYFSCKFGVSFML